MLELKDVSVLVGKDPDRKSLLWDVSLLYPAGHLGAIVGPSGCGKSTLLKTIAGLIEPSTGTVHWQGRDLSEGEDLAPAEIGYVPQFSIAYEHLDVWESVETAMRLRVAEIDPVELQDRTESILHEVGLDGIYDRRVKVLSGGQRRRLALALEMVTSPELLLCDEVTSGLDPKAEEDIVQVLHAISKKEKRIVLSVTHSLRHLHLYDSVLVLHEGRAVYHGPGEFLLHYFDVSSPEDVFPRLTRKRADSWHDSWQKHRAAYYEGAGIALAPVSGDADASDLPQERQSDEERAGELLESHPGNKPRPEHPGRTTTLLEKILDVRAADESQADDGTKPGAQPPPPATRHAETPTPAAQFWILLGRRIKIFRRDMAHLWLQVALILGFPCLVAIFALDGLPAIQNLDMGLDVSVIEQMRATVERTKEWSQTGSLVSGLVMFQVVLLTLMAANNGAREIAGERLIFEKEKLGGVHPSSYVLSKAAFLVFLVAVQSVWMGIFVKTVCRFPGSLFTQLLLLFLVNAAVTAVCLGISSMMRSAEQASLVSIYLVGFQLPLSGAVLALPDAIGGVTRPFIAAYWSWSGLLKSMKDTRFYDVVQTVTQTELSPIQICIWVLACHIVVGLFLAYLGCKRSHWE